MAKIYCHFSCSGDPTDEKKCTTRWPETITCNIPLGGKINNTYYNIMVLDGPQKDIDDWVKENKGKIVVITKAEADSLGQQILPPDTEIGDIYEEDRIKKKVEPFNVDVDVVLTTAVKTKP